MNHHLLKPWITAAAALTLASSGWAWQSTTAQQTPEEIAARRRAYEQRQAEARQNQAQNQTQNQAVDSKQAADAETRALYNRELAHRQRAARIERLKTLLRQRGDNEKLAKLEELAGKEQNRYQAYLGRQRERMGAQRFDRAQSALEPGRQRGKKEKAEHERRKASAENAQRPAPEHPTPQHPNTVPPRRPPARIR